MKLTLAQISASDQAIQILANAKGGPDGLPAKVRYWIGKLVDQLAAESNHINERQIDLLKTYGEEMSDHPGQFTFPTSEKAIAYQKEFQELLQEEVEVKFTPIPFEMLEKVPDLTALHMRSLFWLIEEPEEELETA